MYEDLVLCNMHPANILERIKEFEYLPGDVLLATYPKTGTTWAQELLWLLCNDGDLEKAKTTGMLERFPHMELSAGPDGPHFIDGIAKLSGTRTIKSHLPARFFPKVLSDNKQKVVVVVRNPKDTLVSLFHFYRMNVCLGNFAGSWDDFFSLYEQGHMYFGDFFDWYMAWWQYKDRENVLFISYEDMKKDLKKVIKEVSAFLEKDLAESTIDNMVHHLGFDQMKKNNTTNYRDAPILKQEISPFMRKGVIGDWANYFSQAQSDLVDQRYIETLEKAGLVLQFQ